MSACVRVAETTLWSREPISADRIPEVAELLFNEVMKHEEFVVGQGRDPALLIRCVDYLKARHAMPPMRDDVTWFRDMFEVLVELAVPNSESSPEDELFFQDIEAGIAACRADYADL